VENFKIWVGVDLGAAGHQVCVVDRERNILLERKSKHEGASTAQLIDELLGLVDGAAELIGVALETPQSAIAEAMLDRGLHVYSINPKQLDRLRDRYTVAGAKDDRRDAFVLAATLCTDGHHYREIRLGSAELVRLRELSRLHDELGTEENGLANRIDGELLRYFPEMRKVGSVHTDEWMLSLLKLAPTPAKARKLRASTIRSVLERVRRITADEIMTIFREPSLKVAPGVTEACAHHIALLSRRLRLVREQKAETHLQMRRLLEKLSEPVESQDPKIVEHRDAAIIQSLPGVGTIVSATMLAEAWQPLQDRDYTRLRALCGSAPVTRRSGKTSVTVMRRACSPRLRQALYHWARCGVQNDARTKAHYRRLRLAGHTHGRALRGVADRLLALLVKLLEGGQLFDPSRWTPISA